MKRIAVFGKPGSGKSTLSKRLSAKTGIRLHQLDSIEYNADGSKVSLSDYQKAHEEILASESWIVDGFGPLNSFYERLERADTLIYIDLPYWTSYWLVTKRLVKGLFVKPEGWPDGSSVLKGSLQSYKVLRLCPEFWNDEFMARLKITSKGRKLYVINSFTELRDLDAYNQ